MFAKILLKNIKGISPGSTTFAHTKMPFDIDVKYVVGLEIIIIKTKNESTTIINCAKFIFDFDIL